jgi:hypothetical protein
MKLIVENKEIRAVDKYIHRDQTKSRIHMFVKTGAMTEFYALPIKDRVPLYRAAITPLLPPGTEIAWDAKTAGFVIKTGEQLQFTDGSLGNLCIDLKAVT